MPDISGISGVPQASISKRTGKLKTNIASLSKRFISLLDKFKFPDAGGGEGGGGDPVSTKAVVYDGVDATSLVIDQHSFSRILDNSTNDKATLSIWVNLQGVTDTSVQYLLGNISVIGVVSVSNFLTIKRASSSDPSNITVFAQNGESNPKGTTANAFWKEVETTTGVTDDWIHICLVVTKAIGNGYDTSIYINGSSASNTSTTNTVSFQNTIKTGQIGLGSTYSISSATITQFAEMKLSDYIVWSDELTSSEITEIYDAGVGEFDPSTNSGNYASSADLEIHYEVGNTAEDTTESPVTNNTGTTSNLVHTNVEFEAL